MQQADLCDIFCSSKATKQSKLEASVNFEKLERVSLCIGDKNLYLTRKGRIKKLCEIYSVVNCMHGGLGENGGFRGLFDIAKMHYPSFFSYYS